MPSGTSLMSIRREDSGWVEISTVLPVFERLIEIYGTKAQVAKALGLHKQGFLAPSKKYMQRRTFDRCLALLAEHEQHLARKKSGHHVEVISGSALSTILRRWVVNFLAEHERDYGPFAGPMQVLAFRSGFSVRRASGYANGEYEFVSVEAADKLLTAIDEGYHLSNGTLEIVVNPALSMEAWVAWMERRGCI